MSARNNHDCGHRDWFDVLDVWEDGDVVLLCKTCGNEVWVHIPTAIEHDPFREPETSK